MAAPITQYVGQDTISTIRVNTDIDTTGETVHVYITDSAGTATSAGNEAGDSVNTDIDISCDWSSFDPGRYYLEVISDPTGTPKLLVPNDTTGRPYYLVIEDTYAIA